MVFQNLIGNGVSWSFSSDTGKFKVCSGWWHHSDWRRQACICHRGTAVHQDGHGGESPPLPDGGHGPRHHRQAAQRTGSQLREGRLRQGAVLTGVLLALWGSGIKCLMNPWVSVSSYSWLEVGWLGGQESTCQAGNAGSIPGWGRSPGEGNGNPL